MIEKMHPDDIGEGLEQTAKQLRAGIVPMLGAPALANLLDQAREYMDHPGPSPQPPTREQIAEATLSAMAPAIPDRGARARTSGRVADAVLALFPQPTPSAEPKREPCTAETHSWEHFRSTQVDSYWIRCTKWGEHEEHEDSNTGLTWRDPSTIRDVTLPPATQEEGDRG